MPRSPLTITGAAFRDFYVNHWPKGWYVEDLPYSIEDEDGNLVLNPEDTVDLTDCGYAQWEGGEDGREHLRGDETSQSNVEMDAFYARIMGDQTDVVYLTVKGDAATVEALRLAAEGAGLTIVG